MEKIGSAEIISGKKTKGYLNLGCDLNNASMKIPVLVASGKEKGPTLWVHGGIHGEEYGGTASIINYHNSLDINTLKGTLISVPVLNISSFKNKSRTAPIDGANLNRIFPGNADGTYSQQLAKFILSTIKDHADYVLDFHSGGIGARVPYYFIVKNDGSECYTNSLSLAKSMGSKVIWESKDESTVDGTITGGLTALNIPSVTVECGGGNVTKEHEESFKNSILNAMKKLSMIDGNSDVQESYTIISDAEFIFAKHGGLFNPKCDVGDVLNENDIIGEIKNLYGETIESLICNKNKAYIAAVGNQYWPVEPGQLIAEAIPVVREDR